MTKQTAAAAAGVAVEAAAEQEGRKRQRKPCRPYELRAWQSWWAETGPTGLRSWRRNV